MLKEKLTLIVLIGSMFGSLGYAFSDIRNMDEIRQHLVHHPKLFEAEEDLNRVAWAIKAASYSLMANVENGKPDTWSNYDSIKELRAKGFLTRKLPYLNELSAQEGGITFSSVLLSDPVPDCSARNALSGIKGPVPLEQYKLMPAPSKRGGTTCVIDQDGKQRLALKASKVNSWDRSR